MTPEQIDAMTDEQLLAALDDGSLDAKTIEESETEIVEALDAEAIELAEAAPSEEVEEDDIETALSIISGEDLRTAAYESQQAIAMDAELTEAEETEDSTETMVEAAPTEKTKPTKRTAKAKSARPRVSVDEEKLRAMFGDEGDRLIKDIPNLPKKVQDKATNLLAVTSNGTGALSQYTKYALDLLQKAEGQTVRTDQLYKYLAEDRGYAEGTARSQAQQMMQLLPYAGIATRSKNVLTLNADADITKAVLELV